MFKTDNGGVALKLQDVKLCTTETASTWNTRLSQIGRISGEIIICTYSLPSVSYIEQILDKRSKNVKLIVNTKFSNKVRELKRKYPALKVFCRPNVHAKIVLIEPRTVWLSSSNFGDSGWFEHTIGIHDNVAYKFYREQIMKFLGVGRYADA